MGTLQHKDISYHAIPVACWFISSLILVNVVARWPVY